MKTLAVTTDLVIPGTDVSTKGGLPSPARSRTGEKVVTLERVEGGTGTLVDTGNGTKTSVLSPCLPNPLLKSMGLVLSWDDRPRPDSCSTTDRTTGTGRVGTVPDPRPTLRPCVVGGETSRGTGRTGGVRIPPQPRSLLSRTRTLGVFGPSLPSSDPLGNGDESRLIRGGTGTIGTFGGRGRVTRDVLPRRGHKWSSAKKNMGPTPALHSPFRPEKGTGTRRGTVEGPVVRRVRLSDPAKGGEGVRTRSRHRRGTSRSSVGKLPELRRRSTARPSFVLIRRSCKTPGVVPTNLTDTVGSRPSTRLPRLVPGPHLPPDARVTDDEGVVRGDCSLPGTYDQSPTPGPSPHTRGGCCPRRGC